MDTSGFYNKELKIRAGKFVYGPGYELHVEDKDTYSYPVNGWYYFNDMETAIAILNIDINDFNFDLPQDYLDELFKDPKYSNYYRQQ